MGLDDVLNGWAISAKVWDYFKHIIKISARNKVLLKSIVIESPMPTISIVPYDSQDNWVANVIGSINNWVCDLQLPITVIDPTNFCFHLFGFCCTSAPTNISAKRHWVASRNVLFRLSAFHIVEIIAQQW